MQSEHKETEHKEAENKMEPLIATVLSVGVISSSLVVAAGGAMLLAAHGASVIDIGTLHGEPMSLSYVSGIVSSAMALRPKAIIQLGLLILVATPIARVALSVLLFLKKGDYLYVGITGLVLAILILAVSDEH
jgi:uncharacterized membrane protein